jgi:hypothetical protein
MTRGNRHGDQRSAENDGLTRRDFSGLRERIESGARGNEEVCSFPARVLRIAPGCFDVHRTDLFGKMIPSRGIS